MLGGISLPIQQANLSSYLDDISPADIIIPLHVHLCEEGMDRTIAGLDILLAASFVCGIFYLHLSHAYYVNLYLITPRYRSRRAFPGFLIPVVNVVFPLLFTAETWQLSKLPPEAQNNLPEYKINLLPKIWCILCLPAVTFFILPQVLSLVLPDSAPAREYVTNLFTAMTVMAASESSLLLFSYLNTRLKYTRRIRPG
ncbi:DUF4328 domain-containing protein [Dehalococcoides mccartyi]|uniref:DUF4328 domain-containing protein n=1 Tax=Dehalococcoides mccartyi TaxID=61435 RepID=UPI0003C85EE0|nr:DUF4328 domain-containing protein [Dehalococcoides mccartyi]AHB13070.1 putative membrane protein [Dehalococcoides mccartyi GY50]